MTARTCTCDPAAVANSSGHQPHCPEYEPWLIANGRDNDPSMPMADRGHPVWIWVDAAGLARFEPFRDGHRAVISVPQGWSLRPDDQWGVVLVSTFGAYAPALAALGMAREQTNGFRIREG